MCFYNLLRYFKVKPPSNCLTPNQNSSKTDRTNRSWSSIKISNWDKETERKKNQENLQTSNEFVFNIKHDKLS